MTEENLYQGLTIEELEEKKHAIELLADQFDEIGLPHRLGEDVAKIEAIIKAKQDEEQRKEKSQTDEEGEDSPLFASIREKLEEGNITECAKMVADYHAHSMQRMGIDKRIAGNTALLALMYQMFFRVSLQGGI